jgi:hypothetical protein
MKKSIFILVAMAISGCSTLQSFDEETLTTEQPEVKQQCKKVSRHKNLIKWCRPRISL